jgi:hypothetical protein
MNSTQSSINEVEMTNVVAAQPPRQNMMGESPFLLRQEAQLTRSTINTNSRRRKA